MTTKPKASRRPAKRRVPRSNFRVQRYRDKMRAAGLKPVQIWVPDTKDPAFVAQVQRECELINQNADNHRVLDEMLAVADFSDCT